MRESKQGRRRSSSSSKKSTSDRVEDVGQSLAPCHPPPHLILLWNTPFLTSTAQCSQRAPASLLQSTSCQHYVRKLFQKLSDPANFLATACGGGGRNRRICMLHACYEQILIRLFHLLLGDREFGRTFIFVMNKLQVLGCTIGLRGTELSTDGRHS